MISEDRQFHRDQAVRSFVYHYYTGSEHFDRNCWFHLLLEQQKVSEWNEEMVRTNPFSRL